VAERQLSTGEADAAGLQDGGSEDGVDAQAPSRYIPKEVVSRLLEDARDRCCVCRVLIDPQRFDSEAQFGSLEKHHIISLSEGGGNRGWRLGSE
jgi:hypothetical protein